MVRCCHLLFPMLHNRTRFCNLKCTRFEKPISFIRSNIVYMLREPKKYCNHLRLRFLNRKTLCLVHYSKANWRENNSVCIHVIFAFVTAKRYRSTERQHAKHRKCREMNVSFFLQIALW